MMNRSTKIGISLLISILILAAIAYTCDATGSGWGSGGEVTGERIDNGECGSPVPLDN